jgi:predicted TIM-barrel fold metal-dependent hydrolase
VKIDLHVHLVGNGSGGTGCWYRPRGWTRLGEPWLLRGFGLSRAALGGNLDRIYAERLLALVRESELDAAVVLAQDEPYRASGEKIENVASFYVPNDYVLGLGRKHPEFLPAVSIHPARRDALEELERCLAGGAVLLKCLPNCQNIDWSDRRYTRFLERVAEAELPLLAHTGGEHTLPVVDARLADPRVLTRPLEIGVVCIAAHCGTGTPWLDRDYFGVFLEMMRRYPRLYGDNSAFAALNFRLDRRTLRRCLAPETAGRLLHGSDTPVPVHGFGLWMAGVIRREALGASLRTANPLQRDYLLKRAMGFPEETFTRAAGLLRRPHPPPPHPPALS